MFAQQKLVSPFGGITIQPYAQEDSYDVAQILLDERTWSKGFGDSSSRIPTDIHDAILLLEERHDGMSMFTISDSGARGGGVIGTTGIVNWNSESETVKIGRTLISPNFWGMNCNHETKLVFIDWIFSSNIGRIECDVAPSNMNSIRSLESFGFTFEGVKRRSVRRTDGTWRDTAVFSMIIDEWGYKRSVIADKFTDTQQSVHHQLILPGDAPDHINVPHIYLP